MSDDFMKIVEHVQKTGKAPTTNLDLLVNTLETSTLSVNPKYEVWQPSPYKCPHCGSTNTEYDTTMILTSNPPQSRCRCKDCGQGFFSGQCENQWQHDQSILNIPYIGDPPPGTIPQVGDWPPAPTPCDPPSYPDIYLPDKNSKVGWICPKCGRALAPHVNSCPYCSEPTTINITY